MRIYEPLLDEFDITFYCGFGTRWVFSNLFWCDTIKRDELSFVNRFGKCLERWIKYRSVVEFDTNIVGVNFNQAVYKANHDPMCPSCKEEEETCRHVLGCDEEGGGKSFKLYDRSAGQLDEDGWNKCSATELPYCICQEAWGRLNGAHCVG